MRLLSWLVFGLAMSFVGSARATCADPSIDPRQRRAGEVDCTFGPPSPPTEHVEIPGAVNWEDRRGRTLESGAGPALTVVAARGRPASTHVGASAVFGMHWMLRYHRAPSHEKIGELFEESDAMRWCLPIACGALGLLFAPAASLLGNELGVDLRLGGGNGLARAGVRPALRYSHGRLRTPSLVGIWVPEVAAMHVATSDGPATYLSVAWSLFPFDYRISDRLAIGADPLRVGSMTDLEGGRGRSEIATELMLTFAP